MLVTEDMDELQLIPGLQDLPDNEDRYMGSVTNGMGLHKWTCCHGGSIAQLSELTGIGLETEHHAALDELEADDDAG